MSFQYRLLGPCWAWFLPQCPCHALSSVCREMSCCTFGMGISGTAWSWLSLPCSPQWHLGPAPLHFLKTSHNLVPTLCLVCGKIPAGCDKALLVSLDFHYGIIRILLTNPLIIAV